MASILFKPHFCVALELYPFCFNSLAPGRPGCHFKTAIFNLVLLIGFFRSSNDNAPRWMPWDLTDDKSTLVQVMAWCRQATSHYLSQCWPSSMSPYGVTRPQWVNSLTCCIIMSRARTVRLRLAWHHDIDVKPTLAWQFWLFKIEETPWLDALYLG